MNSVYCVCTTPDVYPAYANHWRNFPKEITWVSDISKDSTFNLGFTYAEKELRDRLKFYGDVSKKHYWNSYGNRNIIWFYAHLRMLNFYIDHPNYDYYWFFDDDVKMKDWDMFFEGTDKDDSDFLGYFIFKNTKVDEKKLFSIKNTILWVVGVVIYRVFMGFHLPIGNTLPVMMIVSSMCIVLFKLTQKRSL